MNLAGIGGRFGLASAAHRALPKPRIVVDDLESPTTTNGFQSMLCALVIIPLDEVDVGALKLLTLIVFTPHKVYAVDPAEIKFLKHRQDASVSDVVEHTRNANAWRGILGGLVSGRGGRNARHVCVKDCV